MHPHTLGGWVIILDVTLVKSVGNFILLPHIATSARNPPHKMGVIKIFVRST